MVSPSFLRPMSFPVENTSQQIIAGDFNNDGNLDLATSNTGNPDIPSETGTTVSLLLGKGDGTFFPSVTFAVGEAPYGITSGDFNNDGNLDIAVTNFNDNTISVLLGNGKGSFSSQTTFTVGRTPQAITTGDFNQDGILDLAVANGDDNNISVLLGRGDGSFRPQTTFATTGFPIAILTGDFGNNGLLDLATVNQNSNAISVFLGNGNGTFLPPQLYSIPSASFMTCITSADFNNNGNLDLAVPNPQSDDNTVSVLLGRGTGSFFPQTTYTVVSNPSCVTAGDFNCDGNPDLAATNGARSNFSVLLGNGDGTFQPQVPFGIGTPEPIAITTGDFNNDGAPDVAITTLTTFNVYVLLNDSVNPFMCPDLILENDAGTCEATVPLPTAFQCSNVTTTCDPATVPCNSSALVTCTTTSILSNNSESCTFTVTVLDTEPPTLSGLDDMEVMADNNDGTIVHYPPPTATDNCPDPVTLTCNPPSGSFFPVGTTTVTCTATDSSGNATTGTFTIMVISLEEE